MKKLALFEILVAMYSSNSFKQGFKIVYMAVTRLLFSPATDRHTDTWTDIQTERDRQTHKQTDRHRHNTDRHRHKTDRQTDRQTHRQTYTDRKRLPQSDSKS